MTAATAGPDRSDPTDQQAASVLVDAHAHCHQVFGIEEFLSRAQRNFTRAAERLELARGTVGLLALTEGSGEHAFQRLRGHRGKPLPSGWRIAGTHEETSLVARRETGLPLALVAGRQIRLRSGLELLAVGVDGGPPDGGTLEATLAAILETGAVPVLPWGFGKWWLGRGRLVARLLVETPPETLVLADSGTRAAMTPEPRLLARARRLGFRIVAGSDPLPLAREVARPGSFGCLLEGRFSLDSPAASLRELLAAADRARRFGALRPLGSFLRDQLAMQLRKRRA